MLGVLRIWVGRGRLCSSLLGALNFGGAAMGMGEDAAGWFGAPPGGRGRAVCGMRV